ncbi:hypothetical protein GCM10020258_07930 [Sphingomonas yabuuchiae]
MIDPVMADAVDRDDLEFGQPVQQRGVDRHLPTADDRSGGWRRRIAVQREAFGEQQLQGGRNGGSQKRSCGMTLM